MCNLYHVSPKAQIATHFRSIVPDQYDEVAVGPFGTGPFVRSAGDGLECVLGQWGMIRPGAPARIELKKVKPVPGRKPLAPRPRSTNNARIETIASKQTFRDAWRSGKRCLIPAAWYQEPNWETGKNIWWRLQRADGMPWALAGLWSEWVDHVTGEVVPNYTMITTNCDGHPLLGRLHKPDLTLPADAQDKRSVIHVDPAYWQRWLSGGEDEALALIRPQPSEVFDLADARRTDEALAHAQKTVPQTLL
ncbi:SOS response-associated peptidase family protein [Paucibacter sediminis]|uniref:Abasic site processing protein n=1 Tax=Paucibacter sediminis TaxID=3019553 RepID=A0AA95NAH0_9BURK|nr:SOS response-associated peptidase family protein [Paucibacter sp. S2-9]WIT10465.1 SOS response-associated peptidase family protein [Paucibacter sp. S2-9]